MERENWGMRGAWSRREGRRGENEGVNDVVSALGGVEEVGFDHLGEDLTGAVIIEVEGGGDLKGSERLIACV